MSFAERLQRRREARARANPEPRWTDHKGQRVDPNHPAKMWEGVVPNHYTRVVTCRQCGPVWCYELVTIADERGVVPECTWCVIRETGFPVPRPPEPPGGYPTYETGTNHEGAVVATCGLPKPANKVRSPSFRQKEQAREHYRDTRDGTKS